MKLIIIELIQLIVQQISFLSCRTYLDPRANYPHVYEIIITESWRSKGSAKSFRSRVLNPWPIGQIWLAGQCYLACSAAKGFRNLVLGGAEAVLIAAPLLANFWMDREPSRPVNMALHTRLHQCAAGSGCAGSGRHMARSRHAGLQSGTNPMQQPHKGSGYGLTPSHLSSAQGWKVRSHGLSLFKSIS